MSEHYSASRLRRGVAHFLFGKVGSALLSFCGFMLVARLLKSEDYGRYVAMIALVELGLNLASFGMDWVSTRYVPEYRVKAGGRLLAALVLRLIGLQALLLVCTSLLLGLLAGPIVKLLALPGTELVLYIYAGYLAVEGVSRVLRDQMLAQLLLQGRAQFALVLRHLVWVAACAALLLMHGGADLVYVAWIELGAALLGMLAAACGLSLALLAARREQSTPSEGWAPPSFATLWHLAWNSYLSLLLNVPARPQVLTLMVTRLAGVEVAALYGFARNLSDQVLRFLPAELLLGFLRPALVARYVASNDFAALNRQTNVLLGVSLLVLAPLLALVLGRGHDVLHVLGGGRFDAGGVLLALMLLGVALFSQRRILEFIANTVGSPEAIGRASVAMFCVPLMVLLGLKAAYPVWFVPLCALAAELAFAFIVIRLFWRRHIKYQIAYSMTVRIAIIIGIATLAAAYVPAVDEPVLTLVIAACAAVAATGFGAWVLKPVGQDLTTLLKSR